MDSILISIKKLLGIGQDQDSFDQDIIMHINTVFMILMQLGVGPKNGFKITSDAEIWSDFLPEGMPLEAVKSYMFLRVRQLFDPPTSSSVAEAANRQIEMLEWRLNVEVDK